MKNFLLVIEAILGMIVVITVLAQPSKADALSGLIQGSKNETFFAKNKGRTKEAMLIKITIVAMALFSIITVVLNLI